MVSSVQNYNRISGLASGLDTDTLVKQMVQAQSTQLIKLQQSKTLNSWKTDAYREINTKIDDFRKTVQDMRLQSTFMKKTATSAKPDVVGVSISGTPSASNYSIEVVGLPTAAQGGSVAFGSNLSKTDKAGANFSFNLTGPAGTYKIDVSDSDTLGQVISKINDQSKNTGVTASYFDGNGSIVLTTNSTGASSNITISNIDDATSPIPTNNFGIVAGTTEKNTDGTTKQIGTTSFTKFSSGESGTSGKVKINGLELTINSNSFVYDGVKFDLKGTTVGQTVSVKVGDDTQAAFDTIKNFVDKYNTLIDDLNKKISEKKYRDYLPLTDDQKKDMKDTDIKLWEDKAKSGLLANDSTISDFLLKMRNSLMQTVGGTATGDPKSLQDIGITTSSIYQERGKLELDETKLKSVLDSNLEGVKKLFSKTSTIGSDKDTTVTNPLKSADSGFGWRLYDQVNSTLKNFVSIVGSSSSAFVNPNSVMAKQLQLINTNLDKEQRRISDYESNLYKKFSAMETAMSKLNSQSGWLAQQFGK